MKIKICINIGADYFYLCNYSKNYENYNSIMNFCYEAYFLQSTFPLEYISFALNSIPSYRR